MNLQGSITTNDLNAYPNESSSNGNKLNSRNIEGTFQGREVLLSVLAEAPEDEEPGATFTL